MEMEIKNNRFWLLENKADEKNVQRFVYDDAKLAFERLKELMKKVNSDKLLLSTIDMADSKGWNITGVPWSMIAMGLIRGDIGDDLINMNMNKDKSPNSNDKVANKDKK